MHTLETILLLAGAVLVSSILGKLAPKISTPLIQIGLGVILSVTVLHFNVPNIDPEMFLLLFIAPMLYFEAREANKIGLWRNRKRILSLAIGLVIAIVFAVGCTTYLLIPTLPLAAACAMGAALGPTDAVAVTSLKATAELGRKEDSILQGEALLNDASGIVAFQFAVTAAVAGNFSVVDASLSFVFMFVGGIVVGIIMAMVIHRLQALIHERGFDTIAFDTSFELMIPFVIFIVAEAIHVSGILAVVAAGLLISSYTKQVMGPYSAKIGIASSTVSSTLRYILEGIVFVLLGLQLPQIVFRQWTDTAITNEMLILYVLILTVVVVGVRFLWIYVGEKRAARAEKRRKESQAEAEKNSTVYDPLLMKKHAYDEEPDEDDPVADYPVVRHALITTLGGAKGAVTLSIVMSIPYLLESGMPFPHRELLIFLASGVVFCTLLLANFFLPMLAPASEESVTSGLPETDEEFAEMKISILNTVIKQLLEDSDKYNAAALRSVVLAYNGRIDRIRSESDELDSEESMNLRLKVLDVQQRELQRLHERGLADEKEVTRNTLRIAKAKRLLTHKSSYGQSIATIMMHLPSAIKLGCSSALNAVKRFLGYEVEHPKVNVRMMLEQKAVDYLESLLGEGDPTIPDSLIGERLMAHQSSVEGVTVSPFNVAAFARKSPELMELERNAYNLELEEVTQRLEDGKISRGAAKLLRDNIYLMMVDLDPEF